VSLGDTWGRKVQVIGEDNKSEPQEAVTLSRMISSDGFSNSRRAGRYGGLSLHEHVELADAMTTVVAQIEDPEALEQIEPCLSDAATSQSRWGLSRRTPQKSAPPPNASARPRDGQESP
jgi:hypothetical protein